MTVLVGVLGLQGAVREHQEALARSAAASGVVVETRRVVSPADLEGLDGLVMPGGESTAMVRLAAKSGLFAEVARAVEAGLPVFGTCAGLILLSREVTDGEALVGFDRVPVLDVVAQRNAYGSQADSFRAPVALRRSSGTAAEIEAVFIRAPRITSVGPAVEVLAEHDGVPVCVRQGHVMAASFHPELSTGTEVHAEFLALVREHAAARAAGTAA